ncbi:hypothetical protein ABB37_04573 [Leptomonas pyrrhocoris]|uniref:Uncharacterized protein n=1 Tax=Leptomonas pyrrhocoris TaxID=157538 RepID=A0A0N0VF63_LEPPY|nr:hypothetical protein ABB37_04573 [Leptomonas pyrrhocoris]KPA80278.1 hypothetical protein ABB37_04573 [Leptomonas pyrrhocoris]|eukprot:XP_015658717.1 hypothetical protein ABB37_04573 [Leptomonas pyrrhocoris]
MLNYDDSFEAESTSADEEEDAVSAHPSPLSNSDGAKSLKDEASPTSKSATSATSPPSGASPTAPSASPATTAPGTGALPQQVPVPIPVNAMVEQPKGPAPTWERSDRSSASSSFPFLPMPRSRAGALVSPIQGDDALTSVKGAESSGGQNDGDAQRRSTFQSSDKLSNSGSAGVPREIAEKAARAGERAEFQALSHFVAFGSEQGSASTTTFKGPASHRTSELQVPPAPSRVPRQFVAFPQSEDDSSTKEEKREPSLKLPSEWPHDAALTEESPQKTLSETKSASVAPSSIFSTLSQHLLVPTPQLQAPATAAAAAPSLPPPFAPSPLAPAATSAAAVPGVSSPSLLTPGGVGSAPLPFKAHATDTTATTTSAPLLTLPSLPPPGWSATGTSSTSSTTAAPSPFKSAPAGTIKAKSWMMGGESAHCDATTSLEQRAQLVAPLPPPPDHHRMAAAEARVSELREASEAVERLVKAFAMLRGYGALEMRDGREQATAKASVSAATTTAHRAGASATVQVRPASRTRGPRVPTAHFDVNRTDPSQQPAKLNEVPLSAPCSSSNNKEERERLAEGLVMDCVLGFLQEHTKRRGTAEGEAKEKVNHNDVPLWQASRPHYEVVSSESFAGGDGAARRDRFAAQTSAKAATSATRDYAGSSAVTSGVPGIHVPLFDPRDRHSVTDLYNAVREALEKYVLRRVRTDGPAAPHTPTTAPLAVTHITAGFAWALLLDISCVCQEITRCAYDTAASSPSAVYPILVQFKGDAVCAEVARAAMHCLPFEVLNTTDKNEASVSVEMRGCLFRMACWVTQEQLWAVSDALMDTVREDVVRRAKVTLYSLFSTAAPSEVDPRLLVPPQLPMFTMLPLPNRSGRASAAATAAVDRASPAGVRYPKNPRNTAEASAAERDVFDVPAAALQRVAYGVSVLSTDILSTSGADSILTGVRAEEYAEVATAVSETVAELLQDEAIKAAVQRRAAEKVKKAQMEKTNYVSASRQRKEQAIIDRAEKEAEEVVRHILQEMQAQGVP